MIDRYALSPMKEQWTLRAQYEAWLRVELAALDAMESLGQIPSGTAGEVRKTVVLDLEEIAVLEADVHHDLLAFLRSLEAHTGDAGRFIHRGLTSSDIKDTGLSLRIRDALDILLDATAALLRALCTQSSRHAALVMIGRTHGMFAEPTTLGLKLLLWGEEIARDIERLRRARAAIAVGKLSGPVGTYSQVSPAVERAVCDTLGLEPAGVANQVLQRDRHAEVLAAIAILGATLEKIALEIRNLSRSEVGELEEPLPEGSSSMPHKRNPIVSERVCGLARLLRSYLQVALESVALWHERDMSHSSVERIIFPDSFLAAHYMTVTLTTVIDGLVVHPEAIEENLARAGETLDTQSFLLALVDLGVPRSVAHEAIRRAAETLRGSSGRLLEALKEDPEVASAAGELTVDRGEAMKRLRAMSRALIDSRLASLDQRRT